MNIILLLLSFTINYILRTIFSISYFLYFRAVFFLILPLLLLLPFILFLPPNIRRLHLLGCLCVRPYIFFMPRFLVYPPPPIPRISGATT